MSRPERSTSPLLVALAWLVVLIPLGWGVVQGATTAQPLFRGPGVPAGR